MRDVLPTLESWRQQGRNFAVATVVQTWGSSPRPVGSIMGVRDDGLVCGSVSGGCVEGATVQEALAALRDGQPRELDFGSLSDASVWEVGLSCGGRIRVWVEPSPDQKFPDVWAETVRRVLADEGVILRTRLSPHTKEILELDAAEEEGAFTHVVPPRDRLLIIGASHIALPLIRFSHDLGFAAIVIDPRPALANSERLPDATQIIVDWPQTALAKLRLNSSTYAVVLSHDPKIDDVALSLLLRSKVRYIGALGSRSTQAKRREELAAMGFTEADLSRIHGPIGLSIGAKSPEEIAISILAEIIQVRRAG